MEKISQALTEDEFYILQKLVLEKAAHKQVAQELGITIWNSQQRLTRIRKKLYEVFPDRKDKKKFKK